MSFITYDNNYSCKFSVCIYYVVQTYCYYLSCEYNNLQINYYASKYTKILLLSLSRAFEKVTLIFSNFSMGFTFSSLQNILLHFAHVIIIVAGRLR